MIDKYSETWLSITALANKQLSISQKQIAAYGVDERVADYHRGRIVAMYDILKLEEKDK